MSRHGHGGDASSSPVDRIASAQGAMPAPQDDSVNQGGNNIAERPVSMSQDQPALAACSALQHMHHVEILQTRQSVDELPEVDKNGGTMKCPEEIGVLQETEGGDKKLWAPMGTNSMEEENVTQVKDSNVATEAAVASDRPAVTDSLAPPLQTSIPSLAVGRAPVQEVWEKTAPIMPSPHQMSMPSLVTSSALIKDIWEETAPMAFAEVTAMLESKGKLLIGMDTEFVIPDGAVLQRREPPTADDHYKQLCAYVNGGNLVQIGLAIADSEFQVLGTWQFNMKFSPKWRNPQHAGVAFLRDIAKLKLQEHEEHGINPSEFIIWFTGSSLLKNVNVTWVTFMGYSDYGFLIRLMQGKEMLPPRRLEFLNMFWTLFPMSYDLRVFTKLGHCRKTVIDGGLAKVCQALGVKAEGEAHQSGSDALSTVLCMERLIKTDEQFSERMRKYCGVLYGMVVDVW